MAHKYDPDYAVHPGETVKECMEMYSMTPWDVAYKFGSTQTGTRTTERLCEEIAEICCGHRKIDWKHAAAFAISFRTSAEFWANRQSKYEQYWKDWMEFQTAFHGWSNVSYTALHQGSLSPNPNPE